MAKTLLLRRSLSESGASGSDSIDPGNESFTCETVVEIDKQIADSVTDEEHLVSIDVSGLQVLEIWSDQDVTLKTNDSGAPQETISFTANEPVVFRSGDSALFAGDVTDR